MEYHSKFLTQYKLNWDQLIHHCLQADPDKRPSSLLLAMDKYLYETKALSQEKPKEQVYEAPKLTEAIAEKTKALTEQKVSND